MPGKGEKRDEDFWREFEERRREKVLAFALGRYLSGWPVESAPPGPLWGLLIATEGGFVFHHFPHAGWIQALAAASGRGEPPAEKTLFIPKERFVAAAFTREKSFFRRLLLANQPMMTLRYRTDSGVERVFAAEADVKAVEVVRCLAALAPAAGSPAA